ncbi:MAG: hypothetical protein ACOYI5_01220 [Christensenellales bacterium]|jgi:hypothetical protein
MKKAYSMPSLELVQFRFSEHVVAASGGGECISEKIYTHNGGNCGSFETGEWRWIHQYAD